MNKAFKTPTRTFKRKQLLQQIQEVINTQSDLTHILGEFRVTRLKTRGNTLEIHTTPVA